eukprot:COSAG06_NODE_21726_length_747_cov_1.640432_1_plen_30_part_10
MGERTDEQIAGLQVHADAGGQGRRRQCDLV